jgi:hypothetical protein
MTPAARQFSRAIVERPCPWCAELIKPAAVVCRFCGHDVVGASDGVIEESPSKVTATASGTTDSERQQPVQREGSAWVEVPRTRRVEGPGSSPMHVSTRQEPKTASHSESHQLARRECSGWVGAPRTNANFPQPPHAGSSRTSSHRGRHVIVGIILLAVIGAAGFSFSKRSGSSPAGNNGGNSGVLEACAAAYALDASITSSKQGTTASMSNWGGGLEVQRIGRLFVNAGRSASGQLLIRAGTDLQLTPLVFYARDGGVLTDVLARECGD